MIQTQILDLLMLMKQRHGLALLLISHDLALVSQVADRVSAMYHGRIVESGLKEEVLACPAHPYTQGLIQCQPGLQHHHETHPLTAIPGSVPDSRTEFRGMRLCSALRLFRIRNARNPCPAGWRSRKHIGRRASTGKRRLRQEAIQGKRSRGIRMTVYSRYCSPLHDRCRRLQEIT